MFENIPYEKPLIIGTGGGNDIISASLVLSEFVKRGKTPDLAGVCSPGAWHTYEGEEENSINLVKSNTRRFIPSKPIKELSFVDSKVPELLEKEGISANVYHLSCRFGTDNLIKNLNELVKERGYDGIIGVDVGGDILARGPQDHTILSPLMDFTTLYVLSHVDVPTKIIEFGLQTDGELRPKNCGEILEDLTSSGALEEVLRMEEFGESMDVFKRIYSGVEKIRHGHTAHMTLRTLDEKEDINTVYRMAVRVLDKKWHHEFPITLESKYFGNVFVIDPKKLAEKSQFSFAHRSPLELFLKTKQIVDTKTEMDLLYSWEGDNCIWLGFPCPQISGAERKEVIQYGLNNLYQHADVGLLWAKDQELVPQDMLVRNLGQFILVGHNSHQIEKSSQIIMEKYLNEN